MTGAPPASGEDEVFAPPARLFEPFAGQGPVFVAVAAGGALGALARYGIGLVLPPGAGEFPLATFLINVVGCLLIGALIVVITEGMRAHPLVRPFLATGILGGFTTFSTYAVDVQQLIGSGHLATGLGYLAATLLAAVGATWLGLRLARDVLSLRRPR